MIDPKYKHVIVVAGVVIHESSYVLQRRVHDVDASGTGLLVLPGGKMEEPDPAQALRRELAEELGLLVHENQMTPLHIDYGTGYVMLYYRVDITAQQKASIKNMEPEKCSGLEWHTLYNDLPTPMWDNDMRALQSAYELEYCR